MTQRKNPIDTITKKATSWIGSPSSIVLHTIFFIVMLALIGWGFDTDTILLVLTTIVSLEAIYLAIFIQYTVNNNWQSITEVVQDINEVTEDVGEINKEVEEISKEVEEISEDVDEISKEVDEMHEEAEKENISDTEAYARIESKISELIKEISALKNNPKEPKVKTTNTSQLSKITKGISKIGKRIRGK